MTPLARALAALVLISLAAGAAAQTKPSAGGPRAIAVAAAPIASFSRIEPGRTRFGALEFLGGLALTANDEHFGGLSGLRFIGDGEEFLAVTDRGQWLRGRIRVEGERPVAVEQTAIAPMLDGNGAPLASGPLFDTESLALGRDGEVHVGVEKVNRILRYDFARHGFLARGRPVETPQGVRRWPPNQGIEGLVFVPPGRPLGGSLLAFSERALDRAGNLRAHIIGGPSPGEFAIRRSAEFDVTDAALVPGGDVLILERHFSWTRGVGMRVRLLPLAAIRPGALLEGTVLIEAGNAHQIDNMEGIAAQRSADGATVLTVVSDDNFSPIQRTLLLRFALREHVRAAAP